MAQTDPAAAIAWVKQLSPGKVQQEAAHLMINQLAGDDPVAAGEFALALTDGSSRDEAVSSVAAQWARQDLAGALEWVKQLPEGSMRDRAMDNMSHHWAAADPEKMSEYVLTITSKTEQGSLVNTLINKWSESNPAAPQAWAARLPDDALRERAYMSILPNWRGNRLGRQRRSRPPYPLVTRRAGPRMACSRRGPPPIQRELRPGHRPFPKAPFATKACAGSSIPGPTTIPLLQVNGFIRCRLELPGRK